MREERERQRRLTLRHRWYAGSIATLLSAALIFTGVGPAMAAEVTPTPTPTEEAITPDESTDSAEPGDDASDPSETTETTETDGSTESEESVVDEVDPADAVDGADDPADSARTAAPEGADEAGASVNLLAVPTPGAGEAVIAVRVGGDRVLVPEQVAGLQGVTLRLHRPNGSNTGPGTAVADAWGTCVSDAAGDCSFVVPNTGAGGENRDDQFWIVQEPSQAGSTAANDFLRNLSLFIGNASGDGVLTQYTFPTGLVDGSGSLTARLRAGETYISNGSGGFMLASSGVGNRASRGIWQNTRENNAFPSSCGLRVALVADLSSSVNPALSSLKSAANTFVNQLVGTPSTVQLFTFGTTSPSAASAANANRPATAVSGGAGSLTGWINGWVAPAIGGSGTQYTNWDAAFQRVAQANAAGADFDVVVVITDGNPTAYGLASTQFQGNSRFAELENGIFSANLVKSQGSRVIALGVGSGVSGSPANLAAISGPTANSDYYQAADYTGAATALRSIALANCKGTVTVVKKVIPFGNAAGDITGATVADGWTFAASTTSTGLSLPTTSGVTGSATGTAGTGAFTFPINFTGVTSGSVTLAETLQSGYTLEPIATKRAVCSIVGGAGLTVTNSGSNPLAFSVPVTTTDPVTCTVYNRAPAPQASIVVSKSWVVNGAAPVADGNQPSGLSASLRLGGTAQAWSSPRTGLTAGSAITIGETTEFSPNLDCRLTSQRIVAVNGSPADIDIASTAHSHTLAPGANTAEVRNTVECTSTLRLEKSVANGPALPGAWTLGAQGPGGSLAFVSGTTGVTHTVTPGVVYALSETGGDGRYVQTKRQGSTADASWSCIRVDANNQQIPGLDDGINGGVTVPIGYRVRCTAVNETAQIVLRKEVVNDNGGSLAPSAWTLKADPGANAFGLTAVSVAGAAAESVTNTFWVRPGHVYTVSETGPNSYTAKLQHFVGGAWVDVAGWGVSAPTGGKEVYRIVNDDVPPTLTLVKKVDNKNGVGTAWADDWTLNAVAGLSDPKVQGTGLPADTLQASISGPVKGGVVYTLSETNGPSGYTAGSWSCVVTGTQTPFAMESATTVKPVVGTNVTCTITNTAVPAEGKITKDVRDGYPIQEGDGSWTVVYDIVVTNTSTTSTLFYDLDDTLRFGGGITPNLATSTWTGPDGVSHAFDSLTETLATGASIPANGSHTYTVTVRAAIANGTQNGSTWQCSTVTPTPAAGGFLNSATLSITGKDDVTVHDCEPPAFPSVTKIGNAASQNPDASWNVSYTVTVTNPSSTIALQAALTDALPAAPAGWTLVGGTWNVTALSGAPIAATPGGGWTPGVKTIWSGTLPVSAAYSYTVSGKLLPGVGATSIGDCLTQAGFKNTATVTSGLIVRDGTGCVTIPDPRPVTIDKTFVSAVQNADLSWTVRYTVKVFGPTLGTTPYRLTDSPVFATAQGVTFTGLSWSGQTTGTSPTIPATLQTGTTIATGQTHTYDVIATATVNVPAGSTLSPCVVGQSGPFYNTATVTFPGGSNTDNACGAPAAPEVEKTAPVTAAQQGGSWLLSYTVTVTNPSATSAIAYTLTDAPATLPPGATLATPWKAVGPVALNGGTAAAAAPAWNGDTQKTIGTGTLPPGASHVYTVSATVDLGLAVLPADLICGQSPTSGDGFWNTATVSNGVGTDSSQACTSVRPPQLVVDKTDGTVTQRPDGTWQIDYTVTVTNATASATTYTLSDVPQPGDGWDATAESGWLAPAPVAGAPIAAAAGPGDPTVHTYVYRMIVERIADDEDLPSIVCDDADGGAFFNVVSLAFPGGSDQDTGCAEPASPTVEKDADDAVLNGDGTWTIGYTIRVTNGTGIQLTYSLSDEAPALPADVVQEGAWTVGGPAVTGGVDGVDSATLVSWNGTGELATGVITDDATHEFTVSRKVRIPADTLDGALNCQSEGGGFPNTAIVDNGVIPDEDSDCSQVTRPGVDIDKTETSTTQNADGTWTITYRIDVENLSTTDPAQYDLSDELVFGAGIVVDTSGAERPSWTGATSGQFAEGAISATLATGKVLGAGLTDTYTVTVNASISPAAWASQSSELSCEPEGTLEAGGFLNTATVVAGGDDPKVADDCSTPGLPTITKAGDSAQQDPSDPDVWTVRYRITVKAGAYPTFYRLNENPGFPATVTLGNGTAQREGTAEVISIQDGVTFPAAPAAPIAIGAGQEHTWIVTWKATVTGVLAPEISDCRIVTPGNSFFNRVGLVQGDSVIQERDACIPVAKRVYPSVDKRVVSVEQDAAGAWTVVYAIDVAQAAKGAANPDGVAARYTLDDALEFGGSIDVTDASWTASASAGAPPSGDFDDAGEASMGTRIIAAGQTHTFTVTVVAEIPADAFEEGVPGDDLFCAEGEPSGASGFLNTATLAAGGQVTEDSDCAEPVFPEIEKTGKTSTQNPDGSWTISYDVTVSYPETDQDPAASPVTFDLTDAPTLPAGVALKSGTEWTATGPAGTPIDDASWNGEGTWTIVEGGELVVDPESETLPSFTYTITGTVVVTAPPTGEPQRCSDSESSGIVVFNSATITSGGYIAEDDGCQVVQYDDVKLEKTALLPFEEEEGETRQTSVAPDDEFDYVLEVTNLGTQPATNVRVTDATIHDRLAIQGVTTPGYTFTAPGFSGNDVDLTLNEPIPVGDSMEVIVRVVFLPAESEPPFVPPGEEAPDPGLPLEQLDNTACVTADHDSVSSNNCDSETVPTRDITAAIYATCVGDAPLLGWTVRKSSALADEPIEFTWTADAATPTSLVFSPITHAGGTTEWTQEPVAWPGVLYTPGSVPIDYPGWRPLEASDYGPGGGFINPADGFEYTAAEAINPANPADAFVFNGLILDPSEIDYAWRGPTTVTISVNPTLEFSIGYPPPTPECFVARDSNVEVEKTASVERTEPGHSFTYDIEVTNVHESGAADGIVVTDVIPADIRITDVSWPGEGDSTLLPRWETCAVTGQDAAGYGGTLHCELFGPLQPAGVGISSAPTITLAATVKPTSRASVVTNVAVVDYYTFADPDDPGRDSDDAVVALSTLPVTGGSPALPLLVLGFLALLGGVTTMLVLRRRRGEAHARL